MMLPTQSASGQSTDLNTISIRDQSESLQNSLQAPFLSATSISKLAQVTQVRLFKSNGSGLSELEGQFFMMVVPELNTAPHLTPGAHSQGEGLLQYYLTIRKVNELGDMQDVVKAGSNMVHGITFQKPYVVISLKTGPNQRQDIYLQILLRGMSGMLAQGDPDYLLNYVSALREVVVRS